MDDLITSHITQALENGSLQADAAAKEVGILCRQTGVEKENIVSTMISLIAGITPLDIIGAFLDSEVYPDIERDEIETYLKPYFPQERVAHDLACFFPVRFVVHSAEPCQVNRKVHWCDA